VASVWRKRWQLPGLPAPEPATLVNAD
jgi:hypothetical protein